MRRPLALAALLLLLVRPAAAQWLVDASAGATEHDAVAASAGTRSAMFGVRHEGPRWAYLSAGLPLDSAGLPWVAGGAGARVERRRGEIELGVDLAGQAHAYRARALDADGRGLALGALPYLAWHRSAARVEVGAGARSYLSAFADSTSARTLAETRAALVALPAPTIALELTGRYLRDSEGGYPFAGVAAELSLGAGSVGAHAGRWLADSLDDAAWGLWGQLSAGRGTTLYAGVEQVATDPLYWNEPRRSWTVGVSRSLGGRARPATPVVAPTAAGGAVEIRVPLAESGEPLLVGGDFNDWRPVPMRREGDAWALSLPLAPGVYRYAFRRPDGSWYVPESVPGRVDDGFGGESAVLVVGPAGGE